MLMDVWWLAMAANCCVCFSGEIKSPRFLSGLGKEFTPDEVSAVARRPRLMISHLWNAKRNGHSFPKRYSQLQALRDAMSVPSNAFIDPSFHAGEEQDEVSDADSDVVPLGELELS